MPPETIALLPAPDLAAAVDRLHRSDALLAVAVGEHAPPALLAHVAGEDALAAALAPGTEVRRAVVRDHDDRLACLRAIAATAERHTGIEQCADELVTNALYAAPVDAAGERMFAALTPQQRIAWRTDREVVVRYGRDGTRFALAVRDTFGSLDRARVLELLDKGLHAKAPVEARASGAGLGLYLVVTLASAVYIRVVPGSATEVTCVFELATGGAAACRELAIVVEPPPAGASPAPPARRSRTARARRRLALRIAGIAAGSLAVAAGVGAWLTRPPADRPPAVATVTLDSQPPGAVVAIDGVPAGTTPAIVTSLAPERDVAVTFELRGYRKASARLRVPALGESRALAQRLQRSPDFVRVRFVSDPPGAAIVPTGQQPTADRTYTPAELDLPAGVLHHFSLVMPKHAPLVIEPFTPAWGQPVVELGGTLVEVP